MASVIATASALELENTDSLPSRSPLPDSTILASEGVENVPGHISLDRKALILLLIQHFSNSWGLRTAEFAVYLFLITSFPDSLLPASVFGFITTGVAIFLSGWTGHQVDTRHNLKLVQTCIIIIKLAACGMYVPSLIMFSYGHSSNTNLWSQPIGPVMFTIIVLAGCVHKLAGTAISVSIERDWVTTISQDSSQHLTVLNTYMRRIDLLCKLLAPLFVSLLTAAISYKFAAYFLCGVELSCLGFELLWIQIVYKRFPMLKTAQDLKDVALRRNDNTTNSTLHSSPLNMRTVKSRINTSLKQTFIDWKEFMTHPIFLSSASISFLYLTVLSFDGTMLSYLKAQAYSDPFLAGMRGINVIAGLLGTMLMPLMERKLGLIRAGNWSVWSEVLCLVPVLLAFYIGEPAPGHRAPAWNAALLFGGMQLSRIGLWAFDLCQLKELQLALATHPRRNSMTALQYSLQNIADMLKYILTIILAKPTQFKWAALTSFISVAMGAITYLAYVKRERGHIMHHDFGDVVSLLTRKSR
ncbi:Ferroporti-1 [Abortiporus biennis]|nr:Ferroporti-1 [Abortiporus biennis]